MKHLSIPNNSGRLIHIVLGAGFLTVLFLGYFTDTASIYDYIIYSILGCGFFYISQTNKIEAWIDENYFRYRWLSIRKHEIMLSHIREIGFKRYKIVVRTTEKDISLDIFNVGKKNKREIIEFLRTNLDVPVIIQ
jgi:hypothetical protein